MARELGFAKAMHGDLASFTDAEFDWEDFALKEELIRFKYLHLRLNLC